MINLMKYTSESDILFKNSRILKVQELILTNMMNVAHSVWYNYCLKSITSTLKRQIQSVTRSSHVFGVVNLKSDRIRRLPAFQIPTRWNRFDLEMRKIPSKKTFINKIMEKIRNIGKL